MVVRSFGIARYEHADSPAPKKDTSKTNEAIQAKAGAIQDANRGWRVNIGHQLEIAKAKNAVTRRVRWEPASGRCGDILKLTQRNNCYLLLPHREQTGWRRSIGEPQCLHAIRPERTVAIIAMKPTNRSPATDSVIFPILAQSAFLNDSCT